VNCSKGNLDVMASTADTPTPAPASDVLVAKSVISQMQELPRPQAASVARAIQAIGHANSEPIRIEGAGIQPGASHFALAPDDDTAPIVIYRTVQPGSGGRWRVTTLMSRDDYRGYRQAEQRGLLDDPTVKTIIKAAAIIAGAIAVGSIISNRGPAGTPSP
jgi:hypothetical protein